MPDALLTYDIQTDPNPLTVSLNGGRSHAHVNS